MAVSVQWIGDLFTHVQADFLETPGLALNADAAATRFGIAPATSAAVLSTLAEAGVLSRNAKGVYRRNLGRPQQRSRRAQPSAERRRAARAMPVVTHVYEARS